MNGLKTIAASVTLLAITSAGSIVMADSAKANCKVYKNGDLKSNASGSCNFSQRQGYVDITLSNGKTVKLSPGNQAHHFTDQKGNNVVRSTGDGGAHKYKWNDKKLIVSFHKGNNSGNNSGHHSGQSGKTPHNLRNLIGQHGAEAEDQLMERGYKLKNSSKSGNTVYSNWKEKSTGRCVAVRSEGHKQVYKSIVYTMDYDCQKH